MRFHLRMRQRMLLAAGLILTGCSGSGTTSSAPPPTPTPAPPSTSPAVDVTTYHYDNARDGLNARETVLTPANVSSSTFGLKGVYTVDGKVDAQPLVVSGLSIQSSAANVLYVATEHDSVYAFNLSSGSQLWKSSALGSGETTSDTHNCDQISPEIGITSTPVIDRSAGTNGAIFVVAMSRDAGGKYHQRLHALDLVTGAERPGSPTEIAAAVTGTGDNTQNGKVVFDPAQYAERAGLLLLNGTLYLSWTSHCDSRPYTGWVMAYGESTLQQSAVLNLTPNGSEGSIWMSGYGPPLMPAATSTCSMRMERWIATSMGTAFLPAEISATR